MKYTKKQREQIAKAFRAAKLYLDDGINRGNTSYICYALRHAMSGGHISEAAYFKAKSVIEHRLRKHLTVFGFLLSTGLLPNQISYRALQQYRHRWLAALIKEFSQ